MTNISFTVPLVVGRLFELLGVRTGLVLGKGLRFSMTDILFESMYGISTAYEVRSIQLIPSLRRPKMFR